MVGKPVTLRLLLAAVLAAVAPAPLAQADDSSRHGSCERYNGRPQQCQEDWRCRYDYQWDACVEAGGGGGGGGGTRECNAYDFDPQTCNSQPGCWYDYHQQRCEGRSNPEPWPRQCRSIYNPQRCEATPGCWFDYDRRQCRDAGGGGGGHVQTTMLSCRSFNYAYERCEVRGQVASAHLTRLESSQPCYEGQSWGIDGNAIWVSDGCRAQFRVSYYPHW
jgi:hypothetical protein